MDFWRKPFSAMKVQGKFQLLKFKPKNVDKVLHADELSGK